MLALSIASVSFKSSLIPPPTVKLLSPFSLVFVPRPHRPRLFCLLLLLHLITIIYLAILPIGPCCFAACFPVVPRTRSAQDNLHKRSVSLQPHTDSYNSIERPLSLGLNDNEVLPFSVLCIQIVSFAFLAWTVPVYFFVGQICRASLCITRIPPGSHSGGSILDGPTLHALSVSRPNDDRLTLGAHAAFPGPQSPSSECCSTLPLLGIVA